MAQIGMMFDATKIDPATIGGNQLPASDKTGWPVIISASEMKETQAKDGSGFLELTLQIIEGPNQGAEGAYRLNIFNKNEKAQEIAHRQLSAICHAIGVLQVADSAMLHNRPFRAVVGLQKDPEAAAKGFTEVKGILTITGDQPGKAGSAPAAAPAAPPVAPPAAPAQAAPATWGPPAAPVEAAPAATTWGAPAATAAPAAAAPPWAVKP